MELLTQSMPYLAVLLMLAWGFIVADIARREHLLKQDYLKQCDLIQADRDRMSERVKELEAEAVQWQETVDLWKETVEKRNREIHEQHVEEWKYKAESERLEAERLLLSLNDVTETANRRLACMEQREEEINALTDLRRASEDRVQALDRQLAEEVEKSKEIFQSNEELRNWAEQLSCQVRCLGEERDALLRRVSCLTAERDESFCTKKNLQERLEEVKAEAVRLESRLLGQTELLKRQIKETEELRLGDQKALEYANQMWSRSAEEARDALTKLAKAKELATLTQGELATAREALQREIKARLSAQDETGRKSKELIELHNERTIRNLAIAAGEKDRRETRQLLEETTLAMKRLCGCTVEKVNRQKTSPGGLVLSEQEEVVQTGWCKYHWDKGVAAGREREALEKKYQEIEAKVRALHAVVSNPYSSSGKVIDAVVKAVGAAPFYNKHLAEEKS